MEITILRLNKLDHDFDDFYAEFLHFIDVPNDDVSQRLIEDTARQMWIAGHSFSDVKRVLSAYKEKYRQAYRSLREISEFQK